MLSKSHAHPWIFDSPTFFNLDCIREYGEHEMKHSFKANLTLVKKHWQHKVVGRQLSIKDGLEPRFCNDISIWIPKLTPKYPEPCMFFHLGNKNSSTYFRSKPFILNSNLQELINTIRSDKWIDQWERIQEVSSELINNDLYIDEDYLDMPLFEKNNSSKI